MTRPGPGALLSRALVVTALSAPLAAAAPAAAEGPGPITKTQCVEADTQAQQLRRDEKLGQARAQLKLCIDAACPALVRDDCAQRLDELDRVQPTLVFDVKDGRGHDLTEVKVQVDGQPLADRVTGAAIPADPGPHTFVFEAHGEKSVTVELVLHEGDKARHEPVSFGKPPSLAPAPSASRGSGQRTAGLLVGGLGVVGLGLGGLFGGLAASKWSSAHQLCATSAGCTPADYFTADGERSNAVTLATLSTVSFVAGGVLAAGGIVLYATSPTGGSSEGRTAARLQLVPTGGPLGAGLTLRGGF